MIQAAGGWCLGTEYFGKSPLLNDLPLWELSEVLLKRRRMEFGGNDNDHLRGGEALQASVVKVEEVVEAENSAADNIAADILILCYREKRQIQRRQGWRRRQEFIQPSSFLVNR